MYTIYSPSRGMHFNGWLCQQQANWSHEPNFLIDNDEVDATLLHLQSMPASSEVVAINWQNEMQAKIDVMNAKRAFMDKVLRAQGVDVDSLLRGIGGR